jgi:hypothetical protein
MLCSLRISTLRAALLLALVAVLSLPPRVEAGSGTVVSSGTDKGRVDLTIKFAYPPQASDIAALEQAIDDASLRLCDATEGQMRLGNVTVTGGSSVGDDAADGGKPTTCRSRGPMRSGSTCAPARGRRTTPESRASRGPPPR